MAHDAPLCISHPTVTRHTMPTRNHQDPSAHLKEMVTMNAPHIDIKAFLGGMIKWCLPQRHWNANEVPPYIRTHSSPKHVPEGAPRIQEYVSGFADRSSETMTSSDCQESGYNHKLKTSLCCKSFRGLANQNAPARRRKKYINRAMKVYRRSVANSPASSNLLQGAYIFKFSVLHFYLGFER